MKTFTLKGFLSLCLVLIASATFSQEINFVAPGPLSGSTTNISNPGSLTLTADRVVGGGNWSGGDNNFTFTFSRVSGPVGGISFVTPVTVGSGITQASTVVNFTQVGTYVIDCTVSENGGETHDAEEDNNEITVIVAEAPTPMGCDAQFYVSHGTAGESGSTTDLEKLTFSGGIISANAFNTSPDGIGYNAIGINPLDGFMYGLRYTSGAGNVRLVRIGTNASNNVVDLGALTGGSLNTGTNSYAGGFDANGDYYFYTSNNELFRITGINHPAVSLAATLVGTSNPEEDYFVDIAIDPITGVMYGVSGTGTSNRHLYEINKANGNLTDRGEFSGTAQIFALFYDELGILYGYRSDGTFQQINELNATQTQVGTAPNYTFADGCSCVVGRVFHSLDAPNGICPGQGGPQNNNPEFDITINVTNNSISQKTGLTYTLTIPSNRFSIIEAIPALVTELKGVGLLPPAATNANITISNFGVLPGTVLNRIVITGFQTTAPNTSASFTLKLKLVTLGGVYTPVAMQSSITGLPANIGSTDLSDDPGTPNIPDDATIVTFCPNITLPAKLLSFSGQYKAGMSNLKWTSENQVDLAFYSVERSVDGINYSNVGSRNAVGGGSRTNYAFTDDLAGVTANVFYYRLRMVDIDGSFTYSNIVMLRRDEKGVTGLSISPNPVYSNSPATVRLTARATGEVTLKVIDMAGKVVLQQKDNVTEGTNSLSIMNAERLQPGLYIVSVDTGTETLNAKLAVVR